MWWSRRVRSAAQPRAEVGACFVGLMPLAHESTDSLERSDSLERVDQMASDSVYRIVDVVGVSEKSWEDAGRNAVETAAGSLRDLRVAEVTKMDFESGERESYRISYTRRALIQVRVLI